ncbi:MAG: phenylalanine--tRNA ligase beta subunit-related protein [Pseudomonadota bacterium]
MFFQYDPELGNTFPQLLTGLVVVRDLPPDIDVQASTSRLLGDALCRLARGPEGEMPAIQAWRAAFSTMGLKPTQYRCASEALLRRLRKDGVLPTLHPVVDVCNAASAAHAVPVAAFDIEKVVGQLTVRPATGDEDYRTFGGTAETPNAGEIIFADDGGSAHARRWTNRQSAASAVSSRTRKALIVIEALHDDAEVDVSAARDALANVFKELGTEVRTGTLRSGTGQFAMDGER